MRTGSRRDQAAVVMALGLHLVAFVAATRIQPAARMSASAAAPLDPIELEVDVFTEPSVRPDLPEAAPVAAGSALAASLPSERHRTAAAGEAVPSPPPAPMGSSVVTDSPSAPWTFSPTRNGGLADISIGNARYRAPVDERGEGSSRTADRVFAEASDHDLALGLGRGGAIKSAIEEVVRDADLIGTAMFDVTLDHAGAVRVDLVHAVGASDVWERFRDPIARRVAKKGVRMPDAGHGLRVRVRVEASSKLADGRDSRSLGTSARATAGEAGTESVAMKEMPNIGIEHRGALGSVKLAVGLNGGDIAANTNFGTDNAAPGPAMAPGVTPLTIGGSFSPENIGSSRMRSVATRVVSETRL